MFKRIFTGYLAVLIISFVVLTLAFTLTVRLYLINDTIGSLYRVARTLSSNPVEAGIHGGGQMRGAHFRLANRIAYAEYVLVTADGTIIGSSDFKAYPAGAKMLNESFMKLATGENREQSLVKSNRVAVSFPFIISGEDTAASLILYSELDILTQLNRSILGILSFAAAAGIVVSLVSGVFVTRVVVGPLQQLKIKADQLARRQFSGRVEIDTGDEVEELAETFNEMAGRLAEYDRAQKVFFQKASHELKTPLMSIQGYAEGIKDGIIPAAEQARSLEIIIKESKRMKALVDEFIYLSKMETLKENYSFEKLSLKEALAEARHSVNSLALEKNIEVTATITPADSTIDGDPEKIHRLLLNILGNALHYAREKVWISLKDRELEIADDGPGFPLDDRDRIFDPFSSQGRKGGSGLGLAISRAIVENHGGQITAGNRPGGGAVIRVSFRPPGGPGSNGGL